MRGPGAPMLAPVRAVARFMVTRDREHLRGAFASRDVVIVENFSPHVFSGPRAVARWAAAFRRHAGQLSELRVTFDPAHDFAASADRAYFTLPTTWSGKAGGAAFLESGAWVFVLVRTRGAWRILAYAWGVFRASPGEQGHSPGGKKSTSS